MKCGLPRPAVLLVCLFALAAPSSASRLYVSSTAPGPAHDGASWTTAYLRVSDAVATAVPTNGAEI